MQPSVTILVTVKNSARTIGACLDSLLDLNYKNYKIYITDAFSTDRTWDIISLYANRFQKKIFSGQISGNISTAYNKMLKGIKSDFVAFTDADCVVDRDWLSNLVSKFSAKDIIAVGGFCGTIRGENKLQELIGKELEHRFENFPTHVSRLPTMNLCVRTEAARRVKFDEKLNVAQETDWGYRLTKKGKMVYTPHARVFHSHRSSLSEFFEQQHAYGEHVPRVYLKHLGKMGGDHISDVSMVFHIFLFVSGLLMAFFSATVSNAIIVLLLTLYTVKALKISQKLEDVVGLVLIFFARTVAWTIGISSGFLKIFR